MKSVSGILGFRGLVYILLLLVINSFPSFLVYQNADIAPSTVLLIFSVVLIGQAVATLLPTLDRFAFLPLFIADTLLAMVLVRATGASSSPFLVLFPVVSLSGAMVFPTFQAAIVIASSLAAMIFSIGFSLAIMGNAGAIVTTGVLGIYLVRALNLQGAALARSEGARRRLESLQKAILANIPSGLVSVDTSGQIIQINNVGLKILGREENELIGHSLQSVFGELSEKILKLNTLAPVLRSEDFGNDRSSLEYLCPDGRRLHLGYSVARLTDPESRGILGVLMVFQDLTQVLELEENLRQSERLAAVGKLAAGIAHEIRNPLAGISGSAQLLAASQAQNDEDQRLLRIIQRESARLDLLIGEFLEYVRPQKIQLESVNIFAIAEEVIESLKVNPKWNSLSCSLSARWQTESVHKYDSNIKALGDPKKITQVLMNLILNAGQAGAKHVDLVIENNCILHVFDDGPGIAPQHQKRVFEPFFTTKESGTGLGLAISYRVLEAMEARIRVASPAPEFTPRGGTVFSLSFRRAA